MLHIPLPAVETFRHGAGSRQERGADRRRHPPAVRGGLTVQAFIQRRLSDADMSPATVAAAHHISLRSLHQLFHDEGLTVAGIAARRSPALL
jgi:hypothetical protein